MNIKQQPYKHLKLDKFVYGPKQKIIKTTTQMISQEDEKIINYNSNKKNVYYFSDINNNLIDFHQINFDYINNKKGKITINSYIDNNNPTFSISANIIKHYTTQQDGQRIAYFPEYIYTPLDIAQFKNSCYFLLPISTNKFVNIAHPNKILKDVENFQQNPVPKNSASNIEPHKQFYERAAYTSEDNSIPVYDMNFKQLQSIKFASVSDLYSWILKWSLQNIIYQDDEGNYHSFINEILFDSTRNMSFAQLVDNNLTTEGCDSILVEPFINYMLSKKYLYSRDTLNSMLSELFGSLETSSVDRYFKLAGKINTICDSISSGKIYKNINTELNTEGIYNTFDLLNQKQDITFDSTVLPQNTLLIDNTQYSLTYNGDERKYFPSCYTNFINLKNNRDPQYQLNCTIDNIKVTNDIFTTDKRFSIENNISYNSSSYLSSVNEQATLQITNKAIEYDNKLVNNVGYINLFPKRMETKQQYYLNQYNNKHICENTMYSMGTLNGIRNYLHAGTSFNKNVWLSYSYNEENKNFITIYNDNYYFYLGNNKYELKYELNEENVITSFYFFGKNNIKYYLTYSKVFNKLYPLNKNNPIEIVKVGNGNIYFINTKNKKQYILLTDQDFQLYFQNEDGKKIYLQDYKNQYIIKWGDDEYYIGTEKHIPAESKILTNISISTKFIFNEKEIDLKNIDSYITTKNNKIIYYNNCDKKFVEKDNSFNSQLLTIDDTNEPFFEQDNVQDKKYKKNVIKLLFNKNREEFYYYSNNNLIIPDTKYILYNNRLHNLNEKEYYYYFDDNINEVGLYKRNSNNNTFSTDDLDEAKCYYKGNEIYSVQDDIYLHYKKNIQCDSIILKRINQEPMILVYHTSDEVSGYYNIEDVGFSTPINFSLLSNCELYYRYEVLFDPNKKLYYYLNSENEVMYLNNDEEIVAYNKISNKQVTFKYNNNTLKYQGNGIAIYYSDLENCYYDYQISIPEDGNKGYVIEAYTLDKKENKDIILVGMNGQYNRNITLYFRKRFSIYNLYIQKDIEHPENYPVYTFTEDEEEHDCFFGIINNTLKHITSKEVNYNLVEIKDKTETFNISNYVNYSLPFFSYNLNRDSQWIKDYNENNIKNILTKSKNVECPWGQECQKIIGCELQTTKECNGFCTFPCNNKIKKLNDDTWGLSWKLNQYHNFNKEDQIKLNNTDNNITNDNEWFIIPSSQFQQLIIAESDIIVNDDLEVFITSSSIQNNGQFSDLVSNIPLSTELKAIFQGFWNKGEYPEFRYTDNTYQIAPNSKFNGPHIITKDTIITTYDLDNEETNTVIPSGYYILMRVKSWWSDTIRCEGSIKIYQNNENYKDDVSNYDFIQTIDGFFKFRQTGLHKSNIYSINLKNTGLSKQGDKDVNYYTKKEIIKLLEKKYNIRYYEDENSFLVSNEENAFIHAVFNSEWNTTYKRTPLFKDLQHNNLSGFIINYITIPFQNLIQYEGIYKDINEQYEEFYYYIKEKEEADEYNETRQNIRQLIQKAIRKSITRYMPADTNLWKVEYQDED